MQKKLLITLALLLAVYVMPHTLYSSSVHAASPLASPSPATLDEITTNLKKRLQDSLGSDATSPTSLARAYIGVVKDIIKDTVVLEGKDGKQDIKLADDTVILRTPGNAVIKVDDIRIDDYMIALGYPDDTGTLIAKRLIVSVDPIKEPDKTTAMGIIKKINKTTLILTIGDQDQEVALSGKTVIKSTVGSLDLSELGPGDTVIYTATVEDDKTQDATIIMRTKNASL